MPKKIFELANELGIGALDLVENLRSKGMQVRNHMSSLADEEVESVLKQYKTPARPTKKKTTVRKKKKAPTKTVAAEAKGDSKKVVTVQKKTVKKVEASPVEPDATSTVKKKKKVVTIRRKATSGSSLKKKEDEGVTLAPEVEVKSDETPETTVEAKSTEEVLETTSEVTESVESTQAISTPEEVSSEEHTVEAESDAPEAPTEEAPEEVRKPSIAEKVMDVIGKSMGLRVVSRPEKKAEEEVVAKEEVKPEPAKVEETGEDNKSKKEYFVEKMHSFTPVFIPKKKEETASEGAGSSSTDKTQQGSGQAAQQGASATQNAGTDQNTGKRLGDLAQMVSKPKAANKGRELEQLKADEELKNYSLGLFGKVRFTPVGRKRMYNGPSKSTMLTQTKESKRVIGIHKGVLAQDLAKKLKIKFQLMRDKCLDLNLLVTNEDYLGVKLANEIASLYNFRVENKAFDENKVIPSKDKKPEEKEQKLRAPVVTVMGHVDHGKTTLLDHIRNTKVVAKEAGGITQHIGAYSVPVKNQSITFLDTPGHAAFSEMRKRGVVCTDIVVLVVAADDGVMPQTRECIEFCKRHEVPMIVAINKMDKEGANPDNIKKQMMEFHITPEEWGGDTQFLPVSALKGEGVDGLLEGILLQAEVMELKAPEQGQGEAYIIEAHTQVGRGFITTAIVKAGTLKKGDAFVIGSSWGKIRNILDDHGKPLKKAGPSTPVQILGIQDQANPGELLHVVKNEKEAKKVVASRIEDEEQKAGDGPKMTLEDFFKQSESDVEKKILKLIVRSDVMGTYEAIKSSLEALGNSEVGVEVITGGTGAITDNDVHMASSAQGVIIGFNVRPQTSARRLSEEKGVEVKTYSIIYDVINDVTLALEGLLEPETVEKYIGRAEVKEIFSIPRVGTIAGSSVIDGRIERGCQIRLLRDGKILHVGKLSTLKRFKDDVKEVKNGLECGISLENYNNIKASDIFEAFRVEEKKRTLEAQ